MGIVKVNRTSDKIKVYNSTALSTQIGTIYPNEVFTWVEEWNGTAGSGFPLQRICFRDSNGNVQKNGWISYEQTDKCLETNLTKLAKFQKVINGTTYYGFKMRRTEELYDGSGNKLSTSAYINRHILCKSSTSGQSHTDWLAVYYIESGVGTNVYNKIMSGNSAAFVDMGYDKGSTLTSNFSLIGSI